MSVLTGWHAYQVYCNNLLIASFMTDQMRADFLANRRARWPQNRYSTERNFA
jgi:hypothetical protein